MKSNSQKVEKEITFPFSIKTIDETGKFDGYASTFGNKDSQGDVVVKGAFKRTIGQKKGKWPILWQHSSALPVGVNMAAEEDEKGLKVSGEINVDSADGEKAYKWMKFAMDRDLPVGLSIGFRIVDKAIENGIRYLKEIALVEYSIVTFPANEEAGLTAVKSATEESVEKAMDFNEALTQEMTERELCDLRWTIESAKCDALCSVQDDTTLDSSKQLALIKTIYDQYTTAMLSWWSKWLTFMAQDPDAADDADESSDDTSNEEKSKTKKVDGVDLSPSSFAYVGDPEKTGTWKLPILFPGDDEKTKRHIRNALARFSQTQGIPAGERAAVLAKIHAAAKKHGIDVSKAYEDIEEKVGTAISASTKKTLVNAIGYHGQAMEMHKSANKLHAKGTAIISNLIGHASQKDSEDSPTPLITAPVASPTPAPARPDQDEKADADAKEWADAISKLHATMFAKN